MSERDEVPAERSASGYGTPGEGATTRPARRGAPADGHGGPARTRLRVLRPGPSSSGGPTCLAALLLISAGIAAALSLVLPWLAHDGTTGLTCVRHGLAAPGHLSARASGSRWRSCSAAACCSCWACWSSCPARSHRFLGVLALLVSLLVATAVLVPLADAKWQQRLRRRLLVRHAPSPSSGCSAA